MIIESWNKGQHDGGRRVRGECYAASTDQGLYEQQMSQSRSPPWTVCFKRLSNVPSGSADMLLVTVTWPIVMDFKAEAWQIVTKFDVNRAPISFFQPYTAIW